jgi:hypothetical protein
MSAGLVGGVFGPQFIQLLRCDFAVNVAQLTWVRWAEKCSCIEGKSGFGRGGEAPGLEAVQHRDSAIVGVAQGFQVAGDRVGIGC